MGQTSVVEGNFAPSFSLKFLKHFCAHFLLSWLNHFDLGIGKIFSSCRTQVMPILVKGDDVKSGTKANTCHRWLWEAQDSMCETISFYFNYTLVLALPNNHETRPLDNDFNTLRTTDSLYSQKSQQFPSKKIFLELQEAHLELW